MEAAGARIHYLHAGSGEPMLLIHGLIGSSANWRNNIGVLAQHASVYAIDLVNMGKSQRVGDSTRALWPPPIASSQLWMRSSLPRPTLSPTRTGEL